MLANFYNWQANKVLIKIGKYLYKHDILFKKVLELK